MVRRAAAGVALAAVVLASAGLIWAGASTPAGAADEGLLQTTPEGFSDAEFVIRVNEDGSARWTIRASRPLENQSEIDQFRAFAEEFETTETTAFRDFRARARRLTAFGSNATGREMNATDFRREARVVELGQTRGVVELSFRWTNFARTDGRRVVVDDVFEGGMFVDSGQRLVMARGEGLAFESVDPPPDSRSAEESLAASETVTWFGERAFADQRPRAVLVPREDVAGRTDTASPPGTPTAGAAPTSTPTPVGARNTGGIGLPMLVVLVIVLLGLGGGFAVYATDADAGGFGWPTTSESGAGATAGAAGAESEIGEAPVADEELLSDEARVLGLLEEHGGRMKQVDIVDETEWSKSKVSMLLSDMEDDGEISKLRVGRENIISKTGHEPEAAGSPFEEE
jgi:hypothetical protein